MMRPLNGGTFSLLIHPKSSRVQSAPRMGQLVFRCVNTVIDTLNIVTTAKSQMTERISQLHNVIVSLEFRDVIFKSTLGKTLHFNERGTTAEHICYFIHFQEASLSSSAKSF